MLNTNDAPLTLGERMKSYEKPWDNSFQNENYVIMRLDGNAFHTYTRKLERPYDYDFVNHMNAVAEAICKKIPGSKFAFTQSDETSILIKPLRDENNPDGNTFFSGRVAKISSLSAGLASATLARLRPEQEIPLFDARIFSLPTAEEVESYFIWRQRDTIKNSVMSVARSQFSHKKLQGKKRDEVLAELKAHGHDWNEYNDDVKYGRLTQTVKVDSVITYTHSKTKEVHTEPVVRNAWQTTAAPQFELNEGRNFLQKIIS